MSRNAVMVVVFSDTLLIESSFWCSHAAGWTSFAKYSSSYSGSPISWSMPFRILPTVARNAIVDTDSTCPLVVFDRELNLRSERKKRQTRISETAVSEATVAFLRSGCMTSFQIIVEILHEKTMKNHTTPCRINNCVSDRTPYGIVSLWNLRRPTACTSVPPNIVIWNAALKIDATKSDILDIQNVLNNRALSSMIIPSCFTVAPPWLEHDVFGMAKIVDAIFPMKMMKRTDIINFFLTEIA